MTTFKILLASLTLAVGAVPAIAGPDFVTPTPVPTDLSASEEATRVILPEDDVVFGNNSYGLRETGARQIASAARYLREHPGVRIVLKGYANSLGRVARNTELSTRRAEMVRLHLIGNGVESDRILVLVYGEAEADVKPSPTDRRVVMFTSTEPTQVLVDKALAGAAVTAMWTVGKVLMTETRATPIASR